MQSNGLLQALDKELYTLGATVEVGLRNKLRSYTQRIPVALLASLWEVINEHSTEQDGQRTLNNLQAYSALQRKAPVAISLTNLQFGLPLAIRDPFEHPSNIHCSVNWPSNHSPLHLFELRRNGPDEVVLASRLNGHVLDTYFEEGKWRTHCWPFHGLPNQQWRMEIDRERGHSVTLTSVASGERLEAYQEGSAICVHTYAPHAGLNQRWWLNFL